MPLFSIHKANKSGFIDQDGREVISPKFEKVFDFEEGLAWASILKNDQLFAGFVTESGDWAIDPIFSGLGWSGLETIHFAEGFAPVQAHNRKMLFVNTKGEPITDPIYDEAYAFSEGRALVARAGKYGFIDHTGREVLKCIYGKIPAAAKMYRFSQGLSPIRYDDSDDFNSPDMGYIDRDGELEFEPQFTYAYPFSEGFTMVRGSLKFVEYEIMGIDGIFLDKNSLKPASFSEGFLEIHDKDTGKSGFIDRSGTWVVEPRFEGTCRFGQGKAAVMSKSRGKWGYIDPNGHKVIAEKYDMAHVFKNGLAAVQEEGRLGYIDMSGKYVWRA